MGVQKENRPPVRGSIFGPLLLIALGIVFLLNNIGALPGDAWDIFLRFWPLLLIVAGLDNLYRREGIVATFLLVGLGSIFLAANLGWLGVDVWRMVIRLWPVLLIAIGFDLILGRRSVWASLVGLLLVLAILMGSLWLSGVRLSRGRALTAESIHQSLPDVARARLILEPGVGSVHVYADRDSSDLVAGRVSIMKGSRLFQDFTQEGDTAVYTLRLSGLSGLSGDEMSTWSWDLGLNPALPLDIHFSIGAGSAELDLQGLRLERLDVNMGVGKTKVTLPEAGRFEARVNGAIGQIVIIVPKGMAVRIHPGTALANLSLPSDYQKRDGEYVSPGYEAATHRIDLDVGMAIGNITVRQAP